MYRAVVYSVTGNKLRLKRATVVTRRKTFVCGDTIDKYVTRQLLGEKTWKIVRRFKDTSLLLQSNIIVDILRAKLHG